MLGYGSKHSLLTVACCFCSATAPERGRFSYMGSRGGALWQRVVFRLPRSDGSSRARLTIEHSCGRVEERETEFFDHLEAELKRFRLPETEKDNAALPFDFLGGYVGYLSYEMKVRRLEARAAFASGCCVATRATTMRCFRF